MIKIISKVNEYMRTKKKAINNTPNNDIEKMRIIILNLIKAMHKV
jgi:hypothetical protein